jgi:3-hydroxymyristoyl/3-hydroxydecanoyl-(acyl carrier protein) dehydratase
VAVPAAGLAAGAPVGAVHRLREQVADAHRAALQAQNALLARVLRRAGGSGAAALPAPAAPGADRPVRTVAGRQPGPVAALPPFVTRVLPAGGDQAGVRTEYDVPAELTVDGQVPVAVLVAAAQGALQLADPASGLPPAGTLTFRAELPAAGAPLQVEAGTAATPTARCHTAAGLVFELAGGPAADATGPAERPARLLGNARFTPLARTDRRSVPAADVALLAAGRVADVFGPSYQQDGCNPSLRLPAGGLRVLDRVEDIDRTGGPHGLGTLTAAGVLAGGAAGPSVPAEAFVIDGALQLLQTYLLFLGAHLVLPDARFQPVADQPVRFTRTGPLPAAGTELRYEATVFDLDLLPRPHAAADVTVSADARPVMTIHGVRVEIREKPGTPYCPGPGGRVPAFLGRTNIAGERAELNELHMAHAAKGDLAVAMGPEFDIYRSSRAPYIPNGDFLFVDRMMAWAGERGRLTAGSTMDTEYDSPADAWYYADNGHPFLPYCVLMETSLQSAVLLGYFLGATLPFPQEQFRIRNLDGRATVGRTMDLRGKTIRQHSTLLFSSAMPGTILQKFSYELTADGETFYTGESLFGYHSEQALATQIGLDAGTHVQSWLDRTRTPARHIDLRGAGAEPYTGGAGLRIGSGQLRLVDSVDLVAGGGDHGAGYLRGRRLVTPDEWYFNCHFHRDPVMPGSLGVEAILQAMQVYVIDSGLAADLREPRFTLPAGVEMGWRYRGQILRADSDMDFDIHVKRVVREPGRVLVVGDANLWKHGLRIYQLTDVAVAVESGPAGR